MSLLCGNGVGVSLVEVKNLSVIYGSRTALRKVDLTIEQGEIVTVVGPNGSGKTSLLRAIIGATVPAEGVVNVKPGIKIGYVPQRLNFNASLPMTVKRFMQLAHKGGNKSCRMALELSLIHISEPTDVTTFRRSISAGASCSSIS